MKLNHLCFADDLFVFSNGDVGSIKIIQPIIQHFKDVSGLYPNLHKSLIYCSGVSPAIKNQIVSVLKFKLGSLPVKYLGVPLISTRLKKEHCRDLVDRISARVLNWSAKALSYAGRLQLINSVLTSTLVYWSSVFLLPMAVIHEVEKICRSFLWHGSNDCNRRGLVRWAVVCKSKSSGGLGVKPIHLWNLASLTKHVWDLVQEKQTLWAIWVIQNKLRRLSFWGITKTVDSSWCWKQLLNLRCIVKQFFV